MLSLTGPGVLAVVWCAWWLPTGAEAARGCTVAQVLIRIFPACHPCCTRVCARLCALMCACFVLVRQPQGASKLGVQSCYGAGLWCIFDMISSRIKLTELRKMEKELHGKGWTGARLADAQRMIDRTRTALKMSLIRVLLYAAARRGTAAAPACV